MAPRKESRKPEKIYPIMSEAKKREGRGKVRKPLPDAPHSKPSEPRPASSSSSRITEVEGKKKTDSSSATNAPQRRSPHPTRSTEDDPVENHRNLRRSPKAIKSPEGDSSSSDPIERDQTARPWRRTPSAIKSPDDDPSPSDPVQKGQTVRPRRHSLSTTKSIEDDPKPSDSVENNQTVRRRKHARAPPRTNPSLPRQPSAVHFQAPAVPFQATAVPFQPPTILYEIPPAPPYPATPNRYLNPSEVSASQNSISQLHDNERLKGMLESFQAAARSIQWNAEQLDRMIASVLGSLPQPE